MSAIAISLFNKLNKEFKNTNISKKNSYFNGSKSLNEINE